MKVRNSLQALLSLIGDLKHEAAGRMPAYCCRRLSGPSNDTPERAGDPAKRVARKKNRLRLTLSPKLLVVWFGGLTSRACLSSPRALGWAQGRGVRVSFRQSSR